MSALAVYRLPYGKFATMIQQTDGEPAELLSCAELNGRQGFVMAPFEITDSHPILLIRPDKVERISVERGKRNDGEVASLEDMLELLYNFDKVEEMTEEMKKIPFYRTFLAPLR